MQIERAITRYCGQILSNGDSEITVTGISPNSLVSDPQPIGIAIYKDGPGQSPMYDLLTDLDGEIVNVYTVGVLSPKRLTLMHHPKDGPYSQVIQTFDL